MSCNESCITSRWYVGWQGRRHSGPSLGFSSVKFFRPCSEARSSARLHASQATSTQEVVKQLHDNVLCSAKQSATLCFLVCNAQHKFHIAQCEATACCTEWAVAKRSCAAAAGCECASAKPGRTRVLVVMCHSPQRKRQGSWLPGATRSRQTCSTHHTDNKKNKKRAYMRAFKRLRCKDNKDSCCRLWR
jgi:hypothetical protein